jgi:hypothetical protein
MSEYGSAFWIGWVVCMWVANTPASTSPMSNAVIQPKSMANAELIVGVYRAGEIRNIL